jgi:hypothetical protein
VRPILRRYFRSYSISPTVDLEQKYILKVAVYIFAWMSPMVLLAGEDINSFHVGLIMWALGALGGMLLLPVLWSWRWEKSLPGILKSMYKGEPDEDQNGNK